jgi:myo-inositol-1(or 4)-monophosphatase
MAEVDHMGPTMELRTEPRTSKRRVDVAIEAAKAAGAVLRDIRETDLVVQEKDSSRTSIVTAADLRSQREIVRIIRRSCPNDMIIGEEGNDGESQTPSRWYVDPLDGTTNYAYRLPFYCTSITYCDTGGVGIGVVHDPLRDDLFVAVRGEGATRNGKRLVVSEQRRLRTSVLSTQVQSDDPVVLDRYAARLRSFLARPAQYGRWERRRWRWLMCRADGSTRSAKTI